MHRPANAPRGKAKGQGMVTCRDMRGSRDRRRVGAQQLARFHQRIDTLMVRAEIIVSNAVTRR